MYEKAIAILNNISVFPRGVTRRPHPVDHLFSAMAEQKLGRTDDATRSLSLARDSLLEREHSDDDFLLGILRETEFVLGSSSAEGEIQSDSASD